MIWPHFREWVLRLRKLGGRKQLDQDVEDELAFHLAMREEKSSYRECVQRLRKWKHGANSAG